MDQHLDTTTPGSEDERDGLDGPPSNAKPTLAKRFVVRQDDRALFVRVSDLDYVQASGNYVQFHVKQHVFKLRATMNAIEARLDSTQFVRIHKSTIVNVDRISEMHTWFGGDYVAVLADGRQLRVSRTYAPRLLAPIQ